MDETLDAMFDPATEAVAEEVVEALPAEAETPPAESAEVQPEVQPEPEPKQDHMVPLPKYLDTRDELKEAKRRIAEFEAKQATAQPKNVPDPYDDPNGFAEYQVSLVDERVNTLKFQMSDQMARQVHGPETVDTAVEWAKEKAQADPVFAASYMREQNPIDWIVRQHKRDGLLSQIGEDPDDYVRRRAAELGLIGQAAAAPVIPVAASVTQAPKPAVPPRSLVDAPSEGGVSHVPTGLKAGVEAVFPR